jgi:O-antigen ligase
MLLLVARFRPLVKVAILPPLFLGGFALVLTFSRAGLLCAGLLACGIGGLALATRRVPRAIPVVALMLALVTMLLVLGFGLDDTTLRTWGVGPDPGKSGVLGTVWTRLVFDPGKAVESRYDLMLIAGEMVRRHPLAGIGLNSFEENMALYDRQGTVNVIHQPVHNVFALVAAETGLPSLAAFLAIGGILAAMSWRLVRCGDEIGFVAGGAGLVVVIGLGCANQFDLTLRKEPLLGTVTLVAAVVAALVQGGERLGRGTQAPAR